MTRRLTSGSKWLRHVSELQTRLSEAEDTLDAIRSGSVDALVVRTPRGEQLFTLKGADQTYRALVEAMNEGAVTLKNGIISYCNTHFAEMARLPMERIFGADIDDLIPTEDFRRLIRRLDRGAQSKGSTEGFLRAASGAAVPVLLSASRFYSEGQAIIGLVVTDITDRKEAERSRQELSRRIINAQEQERQRVARDLHDSVNQLLASAKYRLSSAGTEDGDPSTPRQLGQVRDLIEKAILEIRSISRNLRPSELDDLGLVVALRSLTQDFQSRSGIEVRFKSVMTGCTSPLLGEVEMALYRIVQEALTNVEKHSQASRAEILLTCTQSHAVLTVHDNGKGLSSRAASGRKGWGLRNMNERARLLSGTFEVKSLSDKGTSVYASIPFGSGEAGHPKAA